MKEVYYLSWNGQIYGAYLAKKKCREVGCHYCSNRLPAGAPLRRCDVYGVIFFHGEQTIKVASDLYVSTAFEGDYAVLSRVRSDTSQFYVTIYGELEDARDCFNHHKETTGKRAKHKLMHLKSGEIEVIMT
jgi:hypothetical protein